MKRLLLPLLLAALLLSCSSGKRGPLSVAEGLLPERPDSALTVLDGIDRDALASDRLRAEFDYLRALAFYTDYYFLDAPSEAALGQACLFFEKNGPAVDRMKAWELFSTVQSASGRHAAGLAALRRAEAAAREAEAARMRTGLLLLLAVAILATLVLYFWARQSQIARALAEEKAENDRLMAVAEDLQARLSRKSVPTAGRDALDRLCEQYYVYEGTDNLQPKILKEVKSIVEGLRSDPKVQRDLERALDESADGVMTRLRAAFPKWKEEDFLLYCFTASGFSSTTIAALLGKDKPYVYNRLYRLKGRIAQAGGTDAAAFLSALEK